jgi:L,D-transpeptidase catalytic domain
VCRAGMTRKIEQDHGRVGVAVGRAQVNGVYSSATIFTGAHPKRQRLWQESAAPAVSHGCVRISPENAATLYALVEQNGLENTQVVLTGVTPGGEFKLARVQADPGWGFFGPSFGAHARAYALSGAT